MILVDTSIWVDHLRSGEPALQRLLARGQGLPTAEVVTPAETLLFVEQHRLRGRGIGYVDVQLVAAARLATGGSFWTRDRRLAAVAIELGVAVDPSLAQPAETAPATGRAASAASPRRGTPAPATARR